LLALFTEFRYPTVNVLTVTGMGTTGLVTEFLTAQDAPTQEDVELGLESLVEVYGAGLTFVAGGIPSPLLDLISFLVG